MYQTGEDTYSSAKDEEEFANIRTVLLNTEKELYEQKTASSQLVDNYINSLEKLDNATREEYAKGLSNLKGLRQAIKDGKRVDEWCAIIRAVNTTDAMTATIEPIPYDLLNRIVSRITSEVKGINRVLYDLTPKPTGTIEWE